MARIVYSPRYNIGFFGLERLHPFDSRKYGRAWACLRRQLGSRLKPLSVRPRRAIRRDELLAIHTAEYLDKLRDPQYVATALELPIAGRLPGWMLDRRVLRPMRWATHGTVIAAREALAHGLAINLGGGFHHAKPEAGEGFCIYGDIPLAVHQMRAEGRLDDDARIAYIDLDAHQGNGVCYAFTEDPRVFLFDMFNAHIYPCSDRAAQERIDCALQLAPATGDADYLGALEAQLPGFLDSVGQSSAIRLAIYNAGTDIFRGDPLGGLDVSAEGVLRRDLFVVDQLRQRGIPTVMLLSGGYTKTSYQLVADSVGQLLLQHSELSR